MGGAASGDDSVVLLRYIALVRSLMAILFVFVDQHIMVMVPRSFSCIRESACFDIINL
jgi:hypothetical protein